MSQSNAQSALQALNLRREQLNAEVMSLTNSRDQIAGRLAQITDQAGASRAQVESATSALAEALAGHAMGTGSAESVDEARDRAAIASTAAAMAASPAVEMEALKGALTTIEDRLRSLGEALTATRDTERDLGRARLDEWGADLAARHRRVIESLAELSAEGRALNAVAATIDAPLAYAPLHMPSVIADGLGVRERVVIDVDGRFKSAMTTVMARLHAEGFTGI